MGFNYEVSWLVRFAVDGWGGGVGVMMGGSLANYSFIHSLHRLPFHVGNDCRTE